MTLISAFPTSIHSKPSVRNQPGAAPTRSGRRDSDRAPMPARRHVRQARNPPLKFTLVRPLASLTEFRPMNSSFLPDDPHVPEQHAQIREFLPVVPGIFEIIDLYRTPPHHATEVARNSR